MQRSARSAPCDRTSVLVILVAPKKMVAHYGALFAKVLARRVDMYSQPIPEPQKTCMCVCLGAGSPVRKCF